MYEQYIKERENLDTIKTDKGFICYRINFPHCWINDCFVSKEYRQDGHATFLVNQIFEICKQAGVEDVLCQTDERAIGVQLSRLAILNFGFEEVKKDGPLIFYRMEVEKWEKQ